MVAVCCISHRLDVAVSQQIAALRGAASAKQSCTLDTSVHQLIDECQCSPAMFFLATVECLQVEGNMLSACVLGLS